MSAHAYMSAILFAGDTPIYECTCINDPLKSRAVLPWLERSNLVDGNVSVFRSKSFSLLHFVGLKTLQFKPIGFQVKPSKCFARNICPMQIMFIMLSAGLGQLKVGIILVHSGYQECRWQFTPS